MQGSLTLALRDTYEFMEKYKQSDFPPMLLVQLGKLSHYQILNHLMYINPMFVAF